MSTLGLHKINVFARTMCKDTQRVEEGPRLDFVGSEKSFLWLWTTRKATLNLGEGDEGMP